jgi:hypothetical protein
MSKIKAILVVDAECKGIGKDRYKYVTGMTKDIQEQIAELKKEHGELEILVHSHTNFGGQIYKRVLSYSGQNGLRWYHRQAVDNQYYIVAEVFDRKIS